MTEMKGSLCNPVEMIHKTNLYDLPPLHQHSTSSFSISTGNIVLSKIVNSFFLINSNRVNAMCHFHFIARKQVTGNTRC